MLSRKSNKRGISVVLTTLIIVVASVVLGTAVTLFGTSLFQSGSQQQAILVSNEQLWIKAITGNPGGDVGIGAFVVRNTGDKILSIDSISIRGAQVPFGDWWYNVTQSHLSGKTAAQLKFNATVLNTALCTTAASGCIDLDTTVGAETKMKQATGPVTVQTGEQALIYYILPEGKITTADAGASATVSIFAGSAGSVQTVTVSQQT